MSQCYFGAMEKAASTIPRSPEERRELLSRYVLSQVASGRYTIELEQPYRTVLASTKKVNHVLHLFLSVITFGLWLPIWVLMAISDRRKMLTLEIDEFGNIRLFHA